MFKTPSPILKKIATCQEKQDTVLDLSGQDLPIIPPEVFSLLHLEELHLRNNAIQVLPLDIRQLNQLRLLDLRNNPLQKITDTFGLFIHYVDYQRYNLSPENIVGLQIVRKLPSEIFQLPNLRYLDLSRQKRKHRLTRLPESIGRLHNLTSLDLGDNRLKQLPESISQLHNLTSLSLSYNGLSQLPE